MKFCNKCNLDKDISDFSINKRGKEGLSPWCKECVRINSKEFYKNNREKQLYKSKIRNIERYKFNLSLKDGKKCEKCGETNPVMLDFHHINPKEKLFSISSTSQGYKDPKTLNKILEEIKKCVVLCSNHHREFHNLNYYNNLKIEDYINKLPTSSGF